MPSRLRGKGVMGSKGGFHRACVARRSFFSVLNAYIGSLPSLLPYRTERLEVSGITRALPSLPVLHLASNGIRRIHVPVRPRVSARWRSGLLILRAAKRASPYGSNLCL